MFQGEISMNYWKYYNFLRVQYNKKNILIFYVIPTRNSLNKCLINSINTSMNIFFNSVSL